MLTTSFITSLKFSKLTKKKSKFINFKNYFKINIHYNRRKWENKWLLVYDKKGNLNKLYLKVDTKS